MMKRYLFFVVLGALAVCAAAQDRFYIEDFEISPGDTCTVSIMLDNETAYTAFQADIYLPEGLMVEQEDGDYIFDLTTRKSRDHLIASQLQGDGAIRVMSYSNRIYPFIGNSGALVTFNVIAASDFNASATILIKNILFTTTGGQEVPFADESCHVTLPATGQKGDVNGDGNVNITDVTALIDYLLTNDISLVVWDNADVNGDNSVNITDVTALIDFLLGAFDIPEDPVEVSFTVNGVSFKMMFVKEGSFMMGATAEQDSVAYDRERPAHQVTLSSYYIGETEVTQALWQAVMGNNPSHFTGDLQRPVETVTWNDCQAFIQQLNSLTGKNFRLPNEAEWEYAARGGKNSNGYMYSGSNNLVDVAWYANIDGATSKPVATKSPNELNTYDMSGNVWEWCQDYYAYYNSSGESEVNPTGPASGTDRVYRGGSWNYNAIGCRVSHRNHAAESHKLQNLGFRLALTE